MGINIFVRDYLGGKLLEGSLDVRGVIAAAEARDLPLLASVDVYDDTTFNRKQSARLRHEIDALSGQSDDLDALLTSLSEAVAVVDEKPHRYLVFNGD